MNDKLKLQLELSFSALGWVIGSSLAVNHSWGLAILLPSAGLFGWFIGSIKS